MSNNAKIIIGVIVLLIIIVLVVIQTSVTPSPVGYESATPTPSVTQNAPVASREPIDVPDQPASGNILVRSVTMPADGYIVIHALSSDSSMSGAIGNSDFLTKGVHATIRITLYGKGGVAYKVNAGDRFIAALYKDDGDKQYGKGDLAVPLKDSTGANIVQQFKAL